MYAPGSLVVYRHHVCEVAAVREDYYDGKDYLELHALFQNSLKLFVSAEEAHLPTLRPVMTKRRRSRSSTPSRTPTASTKTPSNSARTRPRCWSGGSGKSTTGA